MTVHIGELHSEVVADPGPAPAAGPGPGPEQVLEALARAEWLARRIGAEGFDD